MCFFGKCSLLKNPTGEAGGCPVFRILKQHAVCFLLFIFASCCSSLGTRGWVQGRSLVSRSLATATSSQTPALWALLQPPGSCLWPDPSQVLVQKLVGLGLPWWSIFCLPVLGDEGLVLGWEAKTPTCLVIEKPNHKTEAIL